MGTLLVLAGDALGMLQRPLGELLGVSSRTIRRWTIHGTRLDLATLTTLAGAVHAKDPPLASRIAAAHGQTLEQLGIVRPPVPAPRPDVAATRNLADAIVCAAAEMADISPRVMRPALAAALGRAREAGLTLEGAHALFAPTPAAPKKK
jgi:hypothetical protein